MLIELPVLESIKSLQSQHGLKYENYDRYRSYCSRRLHRLRRSLNVHQGVASSAKARHQRGRKLMDVSNAMVLEAGEKDPEYGERMLMIPLCLAERAWSFAMQLKHESTEHPRKRYHLVKRLKKASEHAQRFEKLCNDPESPCSDKTKEEAIAYAAYITGLYQVEREDWQNARENLDKSLHLYFKLSISARKETVLEMYRQRIDELRASLRYCIFNLGDKYKKHVPKEKLPEVLQFHDIAFKHYMQIQSEKPAAKVKKQEAPVVKSEPVAIPEAMEEDEDEFEETREGDDDDDDAEMHSSEDDDDDDSNQNQSGRGGGVTGLVKGWLGGAWS